MQRTLAHSTGRTWIVAAGTALCAATLLTSGCLPPPEGGELTPQEIRGDSGPPPPPPPEVALCGADSAGALCRKSIESVLEGFTPELVRRFQPEDVRQAAVARERAIRTKQVQSWKNVATGANGTVEIRKAPAQAPAATVIRSRKGRLGKERRVEAIGEIYAVANAKGANVRTGPGTDFKVVQNEELKANERVSAMASASKGEWLLVGRGDIAIGYVAAKNLKPVDLVPAASARGGIPASPVISPDEALEEGKLTVGAECFVAAQKITVIGGKSEQTEVKLCRTPTGLVATK